MTSPPHKKEYRKILALLILFVFILLFPVFLGFIGLPGNIHLVQGIEQTIELKFPFDLYLKNTGGKISINGDSLNKEMYRVDTDHPLALKADELGKIGLEARLFGIIPLKNIVVNVLPEIKVIPSGEAIGVFLQPEGVLVVEESYVETPSGKRVSPAKEAGIKAGDIILEINGNRVTSETEAATLINKLGKNNQILKLKIKDRKGRISVKEVRPVRSKTGGYMIGVYVDDGIAGVGTLTFYHPETKKFGALGHQISRENINSDNILKGNIVRAEISGVNAGKKGLPGEKVGVFYKKKKILGSIQENTQFGIYGTLTGLSANPYFPEPIPVATCFQIKEGPARMYTVIEGGKIEEFDITIERVFHQIRPAPKGLIVRITDKRLLNLTGGIVQGMSGSPIVQNGRFVGAITHVFVNDPTRGYGVLGEWMIKEAGLFNKEPESKPQNLPRAS